MFDCVQFDCFKHFSRNDRSLFCKKNYNFSIFYLVVFFNLYSIFLCVTTHTYTHHQHFDTQMHTEKCVMSNEEPSNNVWLFCTLKIFLCFLFFILEHNNRSSRKKTIPTQPTFHKQLKLKISRTSSIWLKSNHRLQSDRAAEQLNIWAETERSTHSIFLKFPLSLRP